MNEPLVSIVTPCLNAARFVRKTIDSVLSQDYPQLEYIVMDGGSRDGTLEILEEYRGRLRFFSAPDKGVADAVNRGFLQAHGSILAWLSADDLYYPGAVRTAVARLSAHPDAAAVYGEATWIDEEGRPLRRYPTGIPYRKEMLAHECCVCQPSCFMRREAFEAVGMLDPRLRFVFDYDLWIRLSQSYRMVVTPELLAMSRMHSANLTLGQRGGVLRESIEVLQGHYQYVPLNWIYCYLSFLRTGTDQFFGGFRSAPATFLFSFFAGSLYNRRHLGRFWSEWFHSLKDPRTVDVTQPVPASTAGLIARVLGD